MTQKIPTIDLLHQTVIGGLIDDEGAWRYTLADKSSVALFDHIFANHRSGNLNYLKKIQNSTAETIDLNYESDIEKEFVKGWKIRAMDLSTAFDDELRSIRETTPGQKIPSVILRKKHIYLGTYSHQGKSYPVAVLWKW